MQRCNIIICAVKRFAISMLLVSLAALVMARPAGVSSFQSPVVTPVAGGVEAGAAPSVSPLVWIAAGLLLGGIIVLVVQRAPPHAR